MADSKILVNLAMNGNEIKDVSLEKLATSPTGAGLYEGRLWFDQTSKLVQFYDGTKIVNVPAAAVGSLVGDHDFSTGLPTTGTGEGGAILKGDYWKNTALATVAGIEGDDDLDPLDLVYALSEAAAAAADFLVISNISDSEILKHETLTIALTADTATALGSSFVEPVSVQFFMADELVGAVCYNKSTKLITSGIDATVDVVVIGK